MEVNLVLSTLTGLKSYLPPPSSISSSANASLISVFNPNMLKTFVSKDIISSIGCMTQLIFFLFIVLSQYHVLALMT